MLTIIFLLLLWTQLIYALHQNWMGHSYYDYGWFIPPFIAYFALVRWRESDATGGPHRSGIGAWVLLGLLVAALVPIRIVEHVDPFWRRPLWLHVLLTLGVTHGVVALVRNRATSWHLLPATLLILLTVPLPSFVERSFVSALTSGVTAFTDGFLPLAGYPVQLIGNSFIVNGEPVDVAEGCSGIRSFQSCLAAGFVMGELLRLSWSKRIFLLVAAIALALISNTVRVFVLVSITFNEGKAAMDAAHDEVGLWAAGATYLGIGVASKLMDRNGRVTQNPRKTSPNPKPS